MIDLDAYIRDNRFEYMESIHGDEDKNNGWHAVVDTGSRATYTENGNQKYDKGEAFIDTRMDSIYHLGYGFFKNRIRNEAGTPLGNVHIRTLTKWMNELLANDMDKLKSANPIELGNIYTGTNFDKLIEIIVRDKPTYITTGRQYLMSAVDAAHKMNMMMIYTTNELGIDINSGLSTGQVIEMSNFISRNFGGEWKKLKGKVQGLLGKPRLQFTSIPGVGGSGATVGRIYAIGMGVTGNKFGGRRGPRIWQSLEHLNNILLLDELPEAVFNFTQPRKKYQHEVVNYGGIFEKAMQPMTPEAVQEKISNYINSIADTDQELVSNGSFEHHGSIRRKYRSNPSIIVGMNNWKGTAEMWTRAKGLSATDGNKKIELDVRNNVDSLSQAITTFANRTYNFSLDAYAHTEGTSDFELLIDGEVVLAVSPTTSWEKYKVQFTGKGGEQTIEIRELASQNDGNGAIIDNVSVKFIH